MWYVPCTTHEENMLEEDFENAVDLDVQNDEPIETSLAWKGPKKAWLNVTSEFTHNVNNYW